MKLWVRSQDKRTLINTRRIDVDDCNIICWDEGKYASEVYMGLYKSKERVLEVLDEIQNILIIKNSFNLSEEIINKCFENNTEEEIQKIVKTLAVYEMPEE